MKKSLLSILFILCATCCFAQESVTINGVKYSINGGETSVTQQESASGDIVIPDEIDYNGVKISVVSVEPEAVLGTEITSISLPESITSIGEYSFYGCTNLI